MTDLTYGVRLEASSNVAEVARGDASELARLKETTDALSAASGKMASQYSGLDSAVRQHSAAVTETAGNVNKLLDRYDPLGAKLRQLQADFKALDAAAAEGKIAGRDDARVDVVYSRLQREIKAASDAASGFGISASGAANEVTFATERAKREFMVLGREIASGEYSRIPGTLSIIAQGLSPVALGVAGVTTALAAGVYAWHEWGDAASTSSRAAIDDLEQAQERARKSKHLTDADRLKRVREEISDIEIANKAIDLEIAQQAARAQQPMGWKRGAGETENYAVLVASLRETQSRNLEHIENLKKSEQELAEKINPSTIAIAKQTSELWKNYEIKEKLAKLRGAPTPEKPSDEAIIADAASGLQDRLSKDGKPSKPYDYPELTRYLKEIRREEEALKKQQWKEYQDWLKAEEDKNNNIEKAFLASREKAAEIAEEQNKKVIAANEKAAKASAASWERFTDNVQRNLGDVMYNGMQGKFDGIGDMFRRMLLRMSADAAATNLTRALFPDGGGGIAGFFSNMFSGSSQTGLAGMDQSAPIMWDPLASGNWAGARASGGPVSANSLYRVNERGPELLNYGGEDYLMMGGRGGYVKPLTEARSVPAPAANVTVNLIGAPPGTKVEQRQDEGGGLTLDVIVGEIEAKLAQNISRGSGALNSTLNRTFGLNRAAGAY